MATNNLYIPLINPVKFYETISPSDKYFTKHFDDYPFADRLYAWQTPEDYHQIWQTEDIIKLQFESNFSPIVVSLLDENGVDAISPLPAVNSMPNKYLAGWYAFEVSMSLAGLQTGCYRLKIVAGSGGDAKTLYSGWQFISATPIANTICIEYTNSRYHQDVIFETGITFQLRLHGWVGAFDPNRKDESYRDERDNPTLLNSRTTRQFTVYHGDEFGLPDDIIDLLSRVWSCNSVLVDNKSFCIAENGKFEFNAMEGGYPKRGVMLKVVEGLNRSSSIFGVDLDPTKKLITSVMVDGRIFGDTGNAGSSNAVPTTSIIVNE